MSSFLGRRELRKIFRQSPQLTTERLLLRKIEKRDVNDIYEYASDPRTSEYLLWSPHPDRKYTERVIDGYLSGYRTGEYATFAIVWRESGKMIGTCGITEYLPADGSVTIGYVVNPIFCGCGIATEASRALMKFARSVFGARIFRVTIMDGNDASVAVAKKLGMTVTSFCEKAVYAKGKECDVIVAETVPP